MKDRISISTAEAIGKKHGYDQIIIVARRIGDNGQEWCTTWGKNKENCDAAARIGATIRDNVTPTIERLETALTLAQQRLAEAGKLLSVATDVLWWAQQKCPCENDEPRICPLCLADVAKDSCKAINEKLPPHILDKLNAARDYLAASGGEKEGDAK